MAMERKDHEPITSEDQLTFFENTKAILVEAPMLKASPNISNINEIYKDENSTLSVEQTQKLHSYDLSRDIISEEPEEEENEETAQDTSEAKTIAKKMFNQTYDVVDVSKYTSILGGSDVLICKEYMNLFKPWTPSLIQSLRKLCSKLYLIGESTQIDQILEVFSHSWAQSNSKNKIGDYKTIHIISFAILILNSDLNNHGTDNDSFTRDDFVSNVLIALDEDSSLKHKPKVSLVPLLESFYDSIRSEPLKLLDLSTDYHQTLNILPNRKKSMGGLRSFSTGSIVSPQSTSNATTSSIRNVSLQSKRNPKRLSSIGSALSLQKEFPGSLNDMSDTNEIDYQKDPYDEKLESMGPPWLIEGILKTEKTRTSKNLVNNKSKSFSSFKWFAKLTNTNVISSDLDIYNTKDWRQSIVTIQKGLLKEYSFVTASDRKDFIKTRSSKFVNTIIIYNLYSANATLIDDENQIISNSLKKTEGYGWVLTIPNLLSEKYDDEKKIVYYAPSLEIAHDFIETCNFWAARITPIPSTDDKIVTNAEYGWSNEILTMYDKLNTVTLTKWECLLSIESSFITSTYSIDEQFEKLDHYVRSLDESLAKHTALKPVLERVWGRDESLKEQYQLVMNNWGEKYAHLYKQHAKFKTYLQSLSFAIAFKENHT